MQIIIRASVMFVVLWLVLRIMGRKELAEMSAFELVLIIVMGDLIQQSVTQQDNSITGAVTAVSTFVLWMLAFSYMSFKRPRLRKFLDGQAVIVVRDGEPLTKMLEYERLTVDDVLGEARQQGIAALDEVAVGIIESDGTFSFLRKDQKRPARTRKTTT